MAKTHKVHLSDREKLTILLHARSGAYAPKGHDEQAKLYTLLDEIGMHAAAEDLDDGVDIALVRRMHGSRDSVRMYELTESSVEFFLGKLTDGVNMLPTFAQTLWPVIQRLKDAKRGEYKLPEGIAGTGD